MRRIYCAKRDASHFFDLSDPAHFPRVEQLPEPAVTPPPRRRSPLCPWPHRKSRHHIPSPRITSFTAPLIHRSTLQLTTKFRPSRLVC